jgi:hypothetical protein
MAPSSPATKPVAPITTALAASSRPRRGAAVSETRISPPLTSALMNTKAAIATIVTSTAITQPCTVRNLVHSACTRCQKLSRSEVNEERNGATAPVVMTSPPPGTRRSGW